MMVQSGRRLRLAVLGLGLLVAIPGCGPTGREAARLLDDIAAGPAPSRLKEETPAPIRRAVTFPVGAVPAQADLYVSPEGAEAALVLVPGVTPAGKDDARLVALAESLARVRFAVMVPDIPGLKLLQVRASDAAHIAAAFRWLAETDPGGGGGLGIAAISYAVGPTLMATRDPAVAGALDFLVSVGGYHDIGNVVTFFTTGFYRADGAWRSLPANPYGKWVFVRSNLDFVEDAADRQTLAEMAERRLDDPEAPIADLAARLGPEGAAIHALITNTDRDRVAPLIAGLSDRLLAEMAALDPAAVGLDHLSAKAILIHGRRDPVIPFSESVALEAALAPDQADLYLVEGLMHVDVDLSLFDRLTLWRAATDLLAQRGTRPE